MRIWDTIKLYTAEPFQSAFSISAKDENIELFSFQEQVGTDSFTSLITPQGTDDERVLKYAPNPEITIVGEKKTAGIVVDINTNILYTYDADGNPTKAYQIASGKKSTPTDRGIRIVTHKETYPYKTAYGTKRKRTPKDYGPFVIILEKINPKTGEQSKTGEFIHGCRSYTATFESDPGRYVSHGCMRMDNEAIKVVKEIPAGSIVIIK